MTDFSNDSQRTRLCVAAALFSLITLISGCSDSPSSPTTGKLMVASISPTAGSTTGGTVVTVTGRDFGSDTTLTIAGVAASGVTVVNASTLTATAGVRGTPGSGDVVVTSGGKTATLAGGFAYVAPTGANRPPVVSAIRSIGSRPNQPSGFAEFDETITLVPTVQNPETGTLTYRWSGPGTFTPNVDGTTAWRLPASGDSAPSQLTASLVVAETFTEDAVTHSQESAPAALAILVHDSRKEVLDMGEDFLTLFTRQLPGDQVLHNFSRTCDDGRGRADEENDGILNRQRFTEDFAAFRISRRPPFSVNFKGVCAAGSKPPQPNTDACGSFAVHWEGYDRDLKTNFVTNGIDYISAVVENNQWRLCHSNFEGTANYPALGMTMKVSW